MNWIACSYKKPEEYKKLIVYVNYSDHTSAYPYQYVDIGKVILVEEDGKYIPYWKFATDVKECPFVQFEYDKVTHWMPFPDKPDCG